MGDPTKKSHKILFKLSKKKVFLGRDIKFYMTSGKSRNLRDNGN
jgi:hypothetical protein